MRDKEYQQAIFARNSFLRVLRGSAFFGERRGAALIVALILLLLFALIGSTIMVFSVNDERMITARMNNISALAAAEAGIAESIRRLSLAPSDTLMIGDRGVPPHADWRTYILFSQMPPPSIPPLYSTRSVQMELPESLRIDYSTERVEVARTLVISHKQDEKNEEHIIYYNWNSNAEEAYDPGIYKGKYFPIEVIEATGSCGDAERVLQVEVAKRAFLPSVGAALSCNSIIELSGKLICCGHNHGFATPWGTNAGSDGFECFDEPDKEDAVWHEMRNDGNPHALAPLFEKSAPDQMCRRTGCLPGIATPGYEIRIGNRCIIRGNPDLSNDGTFSYLYQMLNAESWEDMENRFSWQSIEPGTIDGGSFVGYFKCEGDLDLRGVVDFTGVLWVTGTLKQRGYLSMNGILYTGRTLECNGNVWILGAVSIEAKGQETVQPFNGKGVLLYSLEGIERALAAADGYRIIARREK